MGSVVVKVSGHELDDARFLADFASTIAALTEPTIVVHGGGREITELQQKMGIEPRYADGLRITDADSLALVEMVLCGVVNTRLVRLLVNSGVDALGMSGVDRGIVRATKMQHPDHDLGFTGVVDDVRGDILRELLAAGITTWLSIQAFIMGAVTPDSPIPETPASVSTRICVCEPAGRSLMSVILTLPRSAAASRSSGARMLAVGSAIAARRRSRRSMVPRAQTIDFQAAWAVIRTAESGLLIFGRIAAAASADRNRASPITAAHCTCGAASSNSVL